MVLAWHGYDGTDAQGYCDEAAIFGELVLVHIEAEMQFFLMENFSSS